MQYSVDSRSLSSNDIKQGLLRIAADLESRVEIWKRPPAEEEARSETDPEVLENREYVVFRRSLWETFERNDLERILVWLDYRYPAVAIELQAITDVLNEKIPAAKHATQSDLDDLVVDLGQVAYRIRLLAEQIPGTKSPVVVNEPKETPEPLTGRSRQEIYEYLLCDFRREHASRRKGSILLQLVSEKVFQLQKEMLPKEVLFCEAKVLEQKLAPIGESCHLYCEGFRVVYVPYTSEVLQHSERSQFDRDVLTAWETFSDLATHAGAHLSKTFREVMPGSGEKPLANWLQLMFCTLRPQIDLESAPGDCCNFSHIPFSDAADVIELCGLNTSDPILPPLLQERKERSDAIPEAPVQSKGEKTATDDSEAIEELERMTPALGQDNGQWVTNKRAAALEGVKTETLGTYRKTGNQNSKKMFGRDLEGRIWRRKGTPKSHPWYLRSSLISEQSDSAKKSGNPRNP